jgi:hypothetical protein
MSTRLHDLKTVYLDFKIVLNLVKTGYKFDDEDAPAVLRQLEKSLVMLETEIERLRVSDMK